MKTKFLLIACLAVWCAAAVAQTRVMTVFKKDGTKQTFRVAQVDSVAFEEKQQPDLSAQMAINDSVISIAKVVSMQNGDNYTLQLYPQTAAEEVGESPLFTITLPANQLSATIDLSSTTATVAATGVATTRLSGSLRVAFDKLGKNISIELNALTGNGDELRAAYNGTFETAYAATNSFAFTPRDGEQTQYAIPAMLRMKAKSVGDVTSFAFADIAATTAKDLLGAHNAVWLAVSASKLNTTFDLATSSSSYTFRFIDYATGTVYDKVVSGSITTKQANDDKVYVKLEAVLDNGTKVNAEYFGTVTDVESLEEMMPTPVMANQYTFYNADGGVLTQMAVAKVTSAVKNGVTTLTFVSEEGDANGSPKLEFTDKFVNAGIVPLNNLQKGDGFNIQYGSFQLSSPEEKYYGYNNVPDNGSLKITQADDGTYDIYLEIVNSYTTPALNTHGGDNSKLVLSYKGKVE